MKLLIWGSSVRCAPRRRTLRKRCAGTTLEEILIAIMIMGVGMMAIGDLFPNGLLAMRSAFAEDRARASITALSAAVRRHQEIDGSLPESLPQLTPLLQGDRRYEDGKDAGYVFQLAPDGSITAKPAAPGKTGVRLFKKTLTGVVEDVTPASLLAQATTIRQKVRENVLARTAEASTELIRQDPTGQAPSLVRKFIASKSVEDEFTRLDTDHDGRVTFFELLGPSPIDPVLARYRKDVIGELALGAGDEDIKSLPGVGISAFSGDPAVVFTYDTLPLLVKRYSDKPDVATALLRTLAVAEEEAKQDNQRAKVWWLGLFVQQVRAQQGLALSADEVSVLSVLAATL